MNMLAALAMFVAAACTPDDEPVTPSTTHLGNITLTVGGATFSATMEQNSTAEAFRALLPLNLEMRELNGNEKYHNLLQSLPTNRKSVGTIHAGDIMLYNDNCVVVFYKTFETSYSYSPIGHITNAQGLQEALDSGSSNILFEIE